MWPRILSGFTAFLLLLSVGIVPRTAFADSYVCQRVDTVAQVETDGTVDVVERSAYAFEGDTPVLTWSFSDLPWGSEVEVNSVRYALEDEAGNLSGEWVTLQPTSFILSWRDGDRPSSECYSFDELRNTLYVFLNRSDPRMLFELDYSIIDGAQVYEDIAEVSWTYVPAGREVDAHDVHLLIELPVPFGQPIVYGQNLWAWGHGPADGQVSVHADGTVSYDAPLVKAGQFAQAHVLFPDDWLSNVDAESKKLHQGQFRKTIALEEEEDWVDSGHSRQSLEFGLNLAGVIICAVVLLVGIILFAWYGRETPPDFKGRYWTTVPDKELSPSVVNRLWRWNQKSPDDLVLGTYWLHQAGGISLHCGHYPDGQGNDIWDYYVTRRPIDDLQEPSEDQAIGLGRRLLDLLFEQIADRHESLWFGTIRALGVRHHDRLQTYLSDWKHQLDDEVDRTGLFNTGSLHAQIGLAIVSVIMSLVGIVAGYILHSAVYLTCFVGTGVALGVLANYVPSRTPRGIELAARCKGLRRWLQDLDDMASRESDGESHEGPSDHDDSGTEDSGRRNGDSKNGDQEDLSSDLMIPIDQEFWEGIMPYAYMFGLEQRVIAFLEGQGVISDSISSGAGDDSDIGGCDAEDSSRALSWTAWFRERRVSDSQIMPSAADLLAATLVVSREK